MLYVDTEEFQIYNIYDAAFATKYISTTFSKINIKHLFKMLYTSYKIFFFKKKQLGFFPEFKF